MGNTPIVSTAIGLGLETGTFTAKADAASAKLESMTKSFERNLSRTKTSTESFGKSAGGSFDLATKKIDGLGGALRGAQPAIAGMQKGLDLLGTKAPPALTGIANAAISLVSGGFTPLGLAIGVATSALALWTSSTGESTKVADEHTKALERQGAAFRKLIDDRDRARLEGRAKASGTDQDLLAKDEEIASVNERIRGLRADRQRMLSQEDWNSPLVRRAREISFQQQLALESTLGRLANERLLIEQRIAAVRGESVSVTSDAEYQRQRNDEVMRALHPERYARSSPYAGGGSALAGALAGVDTMSDSDLSAQTRRIKQAREMLDDAQAAFIQKAHKFGEGGMNVPSSLSAWDANSTYGDEPAKLADAWERQAVEIKRSTTFLSGFEDQLRRVNVEASRLDTVGASVADSLTTGIGDGLVDALDAAAQGTARFGEAFSSMAESVIADTGRIIVRQLLLNAISGAVSSAFGVSTPKAPDLPPAAYAGGVDPEAAGANWQWGGAHANGGSYTVRGYGGVDSQLVAFKATPGERVDFTPPGRAGGGGGVEVHIHNHSGQPVQQKRSRRSGGGERIDVIVGKIATAAVAADFANGGEAWQALERNAGARRTPRRG